MSRNTSSALIGLILIAISIAACGSPETQTPFFGDESSDTQLEIPEQYDGLRNPHVNDPAQISAGEELYEANCASCHGITGEGDGPASGGLNPSPGNLAARHPSMSDSYMYWRISEGGLMEPFNSIMPGWKGLLDEESIWQIISYVRTMVVL